MAEIRLCYNAPPSYFDTCNGPINSDHSPSRNSPRSSNDYFADVSREDQSIRVNTDTTISCRGVTAVDSQPTPTTSNSANNDPLLAIMPEFIYSMPAQVIVDGINLSLVTILGVQLLFTAQYHFPFSRKNYCLQMASVLLLMISVAVHLNAVLNRLHRQSHQWPYMFAYIGQQIPPQDGSWSTVRQAFYLLLRAVSIALVHVSLAKYGKSRGPTL